MTPSSRYLRLFDLEKYRKIQPVIEGIAKRDIEAERVISVMKAAANILQTDDFKKYNDRDWIEIYDESFDDALDMLQKSHISVWFDELDKKRNSGIDLSATIISLICCPKYQWTTYGRRQEAISGTTVEYVDVFHGRKICDLELIYLLYFEQTPVEMLPIEFNEDGTAMGIFNRQHFTELAQAAIEDIATLSQLDTTFNAANSELVAKYLRFYDDFTFLLELANIRDNYTILNET